MDGMLVHRRVSANIKFAGTHSCTWEERGYVPFLSKCLSKDITQRPYPRLEIGLLDPESHALTIGLPCLTKLAKCIINYNNGKKPVNT